jgi:hypothetical protein
MPTETDHPRASVSNPLQPMTQAERAAAEAHPEPAPVPLSKRARLQAALDKLNHPSNLDLHDRLHTHQMMLNALAQALMPLLTE